MYQTVLNFWFEEINQSQWWEKDAAFDQMIIDRFSALHKSAMAGELFEWRKTARGRLAEIIVLDQFSRNMFRDTAKSFESDPLALALAQEAVSLKVDSSLTPVEKSFLYMPYMHSESLIIHKEAVALYKSNGIESNYEFEIKHKEIIERFDRYPHRNKILNRVSTIEEIEFLKQPGSGF